MPTSLNDIYLKLGDLIAKVDAIEQRFDRADESRANVHRRLDDLLLRTTHLETDIGSIRNRVDAHEKVTVEVTTLRTKAEGAGTLGRWLIRAGIAIVSFAGWMLGLYTWLTGRPPP
jgi:hypothetical protein